MRDGLTTASSRSSYASASTQARARELESKFNIMKLEEARDKHHGSKQKVQIKEELLCPITAELMLDPVFTSDGQTYERGAIERWLEEHDTSPLTGETLEHLGLTPNVLVRGMCRKYLEQLEAETANPDNLVTSPSRPSTSSTTREGRARKTSKEFALLR